MTQRLNIGETLTVKKGWLGSKSIKYAGMPSDSCFSLVVAWSQSYNSAAYNLYFPLDQREVEAFDHHYEVKSVSAAEIELAEL